MDFQQVWGVSCSDCNTTMDACEWDQEDAATAWNTRQEAQPQAGEKIACAFYDGAMAALGCDWWEDGPDFFALVGQDYAAGRPLPATMPKRRDPPGRDAPTCAVAQDGTGDELESASPAEAGLG